MTKQEFWRLRAMKPLDAWTDAELKAEGTTRDEMMAFSNQLAKRLVWERDNIYRRRWKKTGVPWLDEATMILTPTPCARLNRRPAGRRVATQRARRTATRSASRGDPDLADPEPPGWPDAPASPFQAAHRAIRPLARTELRAHVDIAQRRLALLEVAA